MKKSISTRILSLFLVLTVLCGFAVPVQAQSPEHVSLKFQETDGVSPQVQQEPVTETSPQPEYAPTDVVRVSIVMEQASTLEQGFSTADVGKNPQALAYRQNLRQAQATTTAQIEQAMGSRLDVQWNLTLAANLISANVAYGDIETIQSVSGVKDVFLETRYEPCVVDEVGTADPNMATSRNMIGSSAAYAAGYTGAGTRVAIIDTGVDMDHQCFDDAAFAYSLSLLENEYDLLDTEDIAAVLDQLNAKERTPALTAGRVYKTSKIPFGYNYIDRTPSYVDHNQDTQGGHGSHVAGIAVANAYVSDGAGSFTPALDTTHVQGVAPDAQLVVMKVFGKAGGAYDSDYMAAIEDAVILGCASINLSLGSSNPGFSRSTYYQDVMENLEACGSTVTISAGNAGHWADGSQLPLQGYLYSDDVSMHTGGSPGTFANSLCVASVDNAGNTGIFFQVAGKNIAFIETHYTNAMLKTLAGEHAYVFLDGFGTEADFQALADVLKGKVAICSRGESSFYEKAEAAVKYGAIATIIYNNQPGDINMDLSLYTKTEPCVSISQVDSNFIRSCSTPVMGEDDSILYYTGTMTINDKIDSFMYDKEYYVISDFSSYGVPGNLLMKPEISAPGGSIYSVDGTIAGGTGYITMSGTSMAAPQLAGMAALVTQYIQEQALDKATGLDARTLTQSLLMSTARPMVEEASLNEYPVIRQGAGLANVGDAISANSYILMHENATKAAADGKVKVELLDDPERTGVYEFGFTLNNLQDQDQDYILSSALFTQGQFTEEGITYLDNKTVDLMANVTWTADGKTLTPDLDPKLYDVTGDGLVNGQDVQAILDYVLGKLTTVGENADLNGDSEVTSYDAYLLLEKLGAATVTLPASGKLEISVTLQLTEAQKAQLDENYQNGAYIEGFFFVQQNTTAEGVIGTCHSIPLLGFYGNWSDPSMYDRGTFTESLYGETDTPYAAYDPSSLTIRYAGDPMTYKYTANPYVVENTYPAGKEAIRSDTTIIQQQGTLIRNAAATTMVVTDETGKVLYIDPITEQKLGAFYYVNDSSWRNVYNYYTLDKTVAEMGAKEGETITVSLVSIPELYETNGALTDAEVTKLIEENRLGHGAFLSTTFQVDDTAPEVVSISKDLLTGNLSVTARDNRYIAAIQVLRINDVTPCAFVVPPQAGPGEQTSATLDLTDVQLGATCMVLVSDYAGNVAAYTVAYGGEEVDPSGRIFAFTSGQTRGDGKRWIRIDPETLYYVDESNHAGLENLEAMNFDVTAAEYVNGNIYMAGADSYLYVGTQNVWNDCVRAGYFGNVTTQIKDLAYHYQNNTLYALGANNDIYAVDLITCKLTKVANITVVNPAVTHSMYQELIAMTIDDDGNFYLTNYGNRDSGFLYRFSLDDVVDGKVTNLAPVVNNKSNSIGYYNYYSSMAWDHENDILYMSTATTNNLSSSFYAYLIQVDPETGKGEAVNKDYVETNPYSPSSSKLNTTVTGLYVVPPAPSSSQTTDHATGIELDRTAVRTIVNGTFSLSAEVYPWMLEDKAISWSTSNASVATVSDGVVQAHSVGSAIITVTTNAEPHLTATCAVTVENLNSTQLSALIYDHNEAYWSDFTGGNPAGWQPVSAKTGNFLGGTVLSDVLYVHDGNHVYAYDADSLQMRQDCGAMDAKWLWSDAAPAPAIDDLFDMVVGICNDGTTIEMVSPEDGNLQSWMPIGDFFTDPMAAIAYCGSGITDFAESIYNIHYDCPANFYYVLTEGGRLLKLSICAYRDGTAYGLAMDELGHIGIQMPGVSTAAEQNYASMVYDTDTRFLLLTSCQDGAPAQFYVIDPETKLSFSAGDFGREAYPVVSMYQYPRTQELTVKLFPVAASINVSDTVQLKAGVVPSTYENQVTWVSSDPTIASVDENGLVTAMKEGSATITATSVAADTNGNHATATCTVTVKGLAHISVEISGQIVTNEGTQWASIDTSDMSVAVSADAETTFTGAGYHDGMIYGTNSNFVDLCYIYQVDPTNGFAEDMGSACVSQYAFHDSTTAPAETVELQNGSGELVSLPAFGYPAVLLHGEGLQGFAFLTDYIFGNMKVFGLNSLRNDVGAMAYIGDTTYEFWNGTIYQAKLFYALGADGTMYQLLVYANYDYYDNRVGYVLIPTTLGDIGQEFADPTAMTMTYVDNETTKGLVIGYNGTSGAELYFIDLTQEALSCAKIGIVPGATSITGLYVPGEQQREANLELTFRDGTEETCSSPRSFAYAVGDELIDEDVSLMGNQSQGSLQAVPAEAKNVAAEDRQKIMVEVMANGSQGTAVAATNGVATVTYDDSKLELDSVAVHAAYSAVEIGDGQVRFAYTNNPAVSANQPVATLTFRTKVCVSTEVEILHEQVNDEKPAAKSSLAISTHEPVVQNVSNPTCTEDGYTGDTVCSICGDLLKSGEVIPAHCASEAFQDVDTTKWYHPYIDYVVDKGLMQGMGNGMFAPNDDTTRAQFVTVLYRMAGSPQVEHATSFQDVPAGIWYTDAIAWAYANGITKGVTPNHFQPNAPVTREQMFTFFARFAALNGETIEGTGDLTHFTDAASLSAYAVEAVTWAYESGLLVGLSNNILAPKGTSTRAQVATVLTRYCKIFG